MYWRVQIAWSVQSLRRAVRSEPASAVAAEPLVPGDGDPCPGVAEAVRELGDDALGEGVGHGQDLREDVIEDGDVALPVLVEPPAELSLGEREVLAEQIAQILLMPIGVGSGEEGSDLVRVSFPALVALAELCLVVRDGNVHQLDSDEDVALEEVRQGRSGVGSVERDDGVTDVLLVSEQPSCGRLGVAGPGHRRDDVLAGPDCMVGPEPTKTCLERRGLFGDHCIHVGASC